MVARDTQQQAERLIDQLRRSRHLAQTRDASLDRMRRRLVRWQKARLRRTYGDLLCRPRFRPAVEIFLNELYTTHGIADRHLERVAPAVLPTFSRRALTMISLALEMHVLTWELDDALLQVLQPDLQGGPLEEEMVAAALRRCSDQPLRHRQVDLMVQLGRELESVVRAPGAGQVLRLAAIPARLTGLGELHDLLLRGYRAFRKMGDARPLLVTIESREKQILGQIYSGRARPFELADTGRAE